MIKKFIASSELFSYYETTIDISNINDINEIIDIFKTLLASLFSSNNLIYLKEECLKAKWHIHDYENIDDIKKESKDIYICDHC
tara:strand:- start:1969 stop:2220 length:252 start_codon:yes stop_codon:yes gene_type:complete